MPVEMMQRVQRKGSIPLRQAAENPMKPFLTILRSMSTSAFVPWQGDLEHFAEMGISSFVKLLFLSNCGQTCHGSKVTCADDPLVRRLDYASGAKMLVLCGIRSETADGHREDMQSYLVNETNATGKRAKQHLQLQR